MNEFPEFWMVLSDTSAVNVVTPVASGLPSSGTRRSGCQEGSGSPCQRQSRHQVLCPEGHRRLRQG